MNTLQVEIFLAVAECKNFSKVAREKYITQPTVSKHIQNLENELDIKLFTRNKPFIELTPAGKIYQETFVKCLSLMEQAQREANNINSISGSLKIGLLSGWNVHDELMDVMDHFIMNNPSNIDIIVENHSFNRLISGLKDGSLDACIHLHDFLNQESTLTTLPLLEIPKYLIFSSRLDIDIPAVPSFIDFANCIFFAIEENNKDMVKEQLIKYCKPYGLTPTISVLPNIESVLTNVNRGKGVSIIDSYTGTQNYENIQKLEIFPAHEIELAWIKNNKSELLTSFAQELTLLFRAKKEK